MTNWTRAHDAWIAQECEGLVVETFTHLRGAEDYGVKISRLPMRHPSQAYISIDHYLTDPAAAIRAAEAWRKKVQGREVRLEWRENDVIAGLGDKQAGWHQWYEPCDRPAAALAQALYRATGGPA